MKATIAIAYALLLSLGLMSGCNHQEKESFETVSDIIEEQVVEVLDEPAIQAEPVQEVEPVIQQEIVQEPVYTPPADNYNFKSAGVLYDDRFKYTWYSSNDAYHYRTAEWTPDVNGIYRDADGYAVVASSEHPLGTVIEGTLFGTAKVYDTGYMGANHLDVYTNF